MGKHFDPIFGKPARVITMMKSMKIPTWATKNGTPSDSSDTAEYVIELPAGNIWWNVSGHYVLVCQSYPAGMVSPLNYDTDLGSFVI